MERLTHEADFGLEEWDQTLYTVKSDPGGAYNILDIANHEGEREFNEILKNISLRLKHYEDAGLTPKQIDELRERDTAKAVIITGYNRAVGCKVGECPKCGTMSRDYMNFCNECGQRLKWEEK